MIPHGVESHGKRVGMVSGTAEELQSPLKNKKIKNGMAYGYTFEVYKMSYTTWGDILIVLYGVNG